MFNEKVSDLEIAEGNPRFYLFERVQCESVKREWRIIRDEYKTEGNGQAIFDQYISDFTVRSQKAHQIQKSLYPKVREPREWTMQRFLARIIEVNKLFIVMPIPEEETDTIQKLMDSELKVILKKAFPKS